jgi:hypothetical protein
MTEGGGHIFLGRCYHCLDNAYSDGKCANENHEDCAIRQFKAAEVRQLQEQNASLHSERIKLRDILETYRAKLEKAKQGFMAARDALYERKEGTAYRAILDALKEIDA